MVSAVLPTDVVVRDGSTLCLRRAEAADLPALRQFIETLSPRSAQLRFHGLDDDASLTLVAESGGRIVAVAGYYDTRKEHHRAEVALAVADAVQGHGIGTQLLERLATLARESSIEVFDAYVRSDNRRMLDLFRDSGFSETTRLDDGVYHVELSLAISDRLLAQSAGRSQHAAAASMRAFFEPRVVAVVGANRTRGKIGSEILNNLMTAGFTGRIVPVHPEAADIAGLRAYARVSDIPGPVDLAIIVVPAPQVIDAVDDCIRKDIPAICVISAGFSECDAAGRAREALLLDKVRRAGCRLVGPNCMGLLNTNPAVQLNATFSPAYPPRGPVAMSTQSGALGLAILDYAKRLDIGISSFVSVGNKADVSGNDLIQYWADDADTSVILLYLESFGNPKKFGEIARRVGRTKPIVAVKAGRTAAGTRAAASHTGALASNDAVVEALFKQSGVIRTERLEDMFDVAVLLSHQPVPRGPRVAILTNAGGPGILAADACEANDLQLMPLSSITQAELRAFLPAAASVGNPVDMLASAPAQHYERALAAILRDDSVDSVITIFIPPLVTPPSDVAAAIAGAAAGARDKPVLGVFMRADGAPAALSPIPSYAFPESAALALARVTAYGRWRARPVAPAPVLERFNRGDVRRIVEGILERGAGWALPGEAGALLAAAGIVSAASAVATTLDEALDAATRIGFPLALKALGPALLHKTERRAVTLDVRDPAGVREVYEDFTTRFGPDMSALLVQQMVPHGVEMIVGALQDPLFGPLLACGTGGVLVDVLADTAFRLHPFTESDAIEMIDELRGARLLRGHRGAPPADERALRDVLLRVSELVSTAPEIQELDLNPVVVLAAGACVADARVRLDVPRPPTRGRRVAY
jgi:acetyl coenzyme A synthetase (ADP forming)-like protein